MVVVGPQPDCSLLPNSATRQDPAPRLAAGGMHSSSTVSHPVLFLPAPNWMQTREPLLLMSMSRLVSLRTVALVPEYLTKKGPVLVNFPSMVALTIAVLTAQDLYTLNCEVTKGGHAKLVLLQ